MTTYYDIADDYTRIDVYPIGDPTPVRIHNDGSGITIPDDVLSVLADEFDTALQNRNTERALRLVRDAAFEDIEEGTP